MYLTPILANTNTAARAEGMIMKETCCCFYPWGTKVYKFTIAQRCLKIIQPYGHCGFFLCCRDDDEKIPKRDFLIRKLPIFCHPRKLHFVMHLLPLINCYYVMDVLHFRLNGNRWTATKIAIRMLNGILFCIILSLYK